jgi:tryptophan-rich sensory protein
MQKKCAFVVYGFQLILNVLWSYCFFFLKNPGLALADVCVLASLILLNIALFAKLYRPAAILLIPYLIWTLYAASLNTAIWILNR